VQHPAGDERRARRHAGAHRAAHVALDARLHLVAAPVGVEALEVEPELLGARPQVGVVDAALVGEQRVVEGPERTLQRGRLGRRGERGRRGCLAFSAKWRKTTRRARPRSSRSTGQRAVRAREVAVEDDERSAVLAADVVVVGQRRTGALVSSIAATVRAQSRVSAGASAPRSSTQLAVARTGVWPRRRSPRRGKRSALPRRADDVPTASTRRG
jgi:hypothetical protein